MVQLSKKKLRWFFFFTLYISAFGSIVFAQESTITIQAASTNPWEIIRSVFEFLYFISGILMVIIAFKALNQIKIGLKQVEVGMLQVELTKKDINIRSERESILLTAEQCDKYACEIIPTNNKILKYLNQNGMLYKGQVLDFAIDENISLWFADNREKLAQPFDENSVEGNIANSLNKAEAMSIYFTNGVCNEMVAFPSLSNTFCQTVAFFYPVLCASHQKHGYYQNIIKLYNIWNTRMIELKMNKEKDKAYDSYVQAQNTLAATQKSECITPIGVDKI